MKDEYVYICTYTALFQKVYGSSSFWMNVGMRKSDAETFYCLQTTKVQLKKQVWSEVKIYLNW